MTSRLTQLALPIVALAFGLAISAPAAAMDMPTGMKVDSMAMECMTAAAAEGDITKMDAMITDCKSKYPDAAAIECAIKASVAGDAASAQAGMDSCRTMYPDQLSDVMMAH